MGLPAMVGPLSPQCGVSARTPRGSHSSGHGPPTVSLGAVPGLQYVAARVLT